MLSTTHESLALLFRNRPMLAVELLRDALGVAVPRFRAARVAAADFTELAPTEYRADVVVELSVGAAPVLAVVVEIQRDREHDKRYTWPVYLATLRERSRCPAVLLVVCPDDAIAAWCGAAIELGHPNWVLTPLVLGPRAVPIVRDAAAAARAPELAVLSALAHGGSANGSVVFEAMLPALAQLDDERARLYLDVALAALPAAARAAMEALMAKGTYEYQSDFARRYVAEGEAKGKAEAVLAVLAARGLAIPDAVRARVMACADDGVLDAWIRRAVVVASSDAIFE
jgi:hypothetical protein